MTKPAGFRFVTIYHIHWQYVLDYPDVYLPIYRCVDNNDRLLQDSQGKILAFKDVLRIQAAKEFCSEECRAYPNPLVSFPHVLEGGKLMPGDAADVFFGSALLALTGQGEGLRADLLEVLSVVEEIFRFFGSDHKGERCERSSLIDGISRVTNELFESGCARNAFDRDSDADEFARELEVAFRYIASRMRIVE